MKIKPTGVMLILLLLLVPPVLVAADYLASNPGEAKAYNIGAGESDWNATLTVSHPSYLVSGGSAQVSVTLQVSPGTNVTIYVRDFRVELRYPSYINNVTGVVQSWGVLSNETISVHQNYSSAGQVPRQRQIPILYPPTTGPFDLFRPYSQVAMNGVVDLIIFRQSVNSSSATPTTVSVLDNQIVYQSQLTPVRSSASWVAYELAVMAIVLPVYAWRRRSSAFPADTAYTMQLEEFRIRSELAKLEELLAAGNVTEAAYKELKEKYEAELTRIRGGTLPSGSAG